MTAKITPINPLMGALDSIGDVTQYPQSLDALGSPHLLAAYRDIAQQEATVIKALVRREVARSLYALLRTDEVNIVEMSEAEFTAFCENVLSEEK